MASTQISNWVSEDNLRSVLRCIAEFAVYDFDDADWCAFETGIRKTDFERDLWFDYDFSGTHTVRVWVAHDIGTCVVHLKIDLPSEIRPQIEATLRIAGMFKLLES